MFDFGFWELVLVFIVGLLVIGPERLPKVVHTLGLWVGRAQGYVRTVKEDIRRELEQEELKKMLAQEKAALDDVAEGLEKAQGYIDPKTGLQVDFDEKPEKPNQSL